MQLAVCNLIQPCLETIHLSSCVLIDLPFRVVKSRTIGVVFIYRSHEGIALFTVFLLEESGHPSDSYFELILGSYCYWVGMTQKFCITALVHLGS